MRQSMTYLWELLEPVVTGMGFELVEIEFNSHPKNKVLRLYIDKEGGVVIENCTEVSRQVSAVIDVEDPIDGFFNLEVSSPGLDRPLTKIVDFRHRIGENVKLLFVKKKRKKITAEIVSVDGDNIPRVYGIVGAYVVDGLGGVLGAHYGKAFAGGPFGKAPGQRHRFFHR